VETKISIAAENAKGDAVMRLLAEQSSRGKMPSSHDRPRLIELARTQRGALEVEH